MSRSALAWTWVIEQRETVDRVVARVARSTGASADDLRIESPISAHIYATRAHHLVSLVFAQYESLAWYSSGTVSSLGVGCK